MIYSKKIQFWLDIILIIVFVKLSYNNWIDEDWRMFTILQFPLLLSIYRILYADRKYANETSNN